MEALLEYAQIGILILVSLICVIGLVINSVRLQNQALAEAEKRKNMPWTWD